MLKPKGKLSMLPTMLNMQLTDIICFFRLPSFPAFLSPLFSHIFPVSVMSATKHESLSCLMGKLFLRKFFRVQVCLQMKFTLQGPITIALLRYPLTA